jgi:hypothetical protein
MAQSIDVKIRIGLVLAAVLLFGVLARGRPEHSVYITSASVEEDRLAVGRFESIQGRCSGAAPLVRSVLRFADDHAAATAAEVLQSEGWDGVVASASPRDVLVWQSLELCSGSVARMRRGHESFCARHACTFVGWESYAIAPATGCLPPSYKE